MTSRTYRVAIASRQPIADISAEQKAMADIGAELVVVQPANDDELAMGLRDVDAVFNRWGKFDANVIGQLERCRAIVQPSTGYDSIDVDAATKHGVVVINLPFQCLEEVANHALAFVLALNRKLLPGQAHARSGAWRPRDFLPMGPLYGETFGLLGFGNIARETGRRAQAFHMNVIAYDPFVDPALAKEMNVELTTMDDLLRRSDYVSCHLPLNPRTFHAVSAAQFQQMKPSAIFVNTARGPVVDESALIRALQSGWIAAAGIDVLEQEPPDRSNPLLAMDNVIVTPHLAGTSNASVPRNRVQAIEGMVAYLKGEKPAGLVNTTAWESAQGRLRG